MLGEATHDIGLDAFSLAQPRQGPVQFQQKCLALLETYPLGGLGDQAQHPADTAVGLSHGGIGDVEVDGFAQAATLYVEGAILGREGLTGFTHVAQQGFEIVPQFTPVFLARPPQRLGVLVANGRCIGVVVERGVGSPPEQHELRLGRQQRGHHGLQVGRPA